MLVYVPQQAQLLLGKSPLDAGIYLIAYSAVAAVAAGLVNIASSRGRIPFIYSLFVGCALHTIGVGLLSTIASSKGFHATDVVYEVIAGAGLGITMGILVLSPPYIVEDRDLSTFPPLLKFEDKVPSALTNRCFHSFFYSDCNRVCCSDSLSWWRHWSRYSIQHPKWPPSTSFTRDLDKASITLVS